MVESPKSLAILLIMLLMAGVIGWTVISSFQTFDMSSVLSLRSFRAEESPQPTPTRPAQDSGEPLDYIERYPVVHPRTTRPAFAP